MYLLTQKLPDVTFTKHRRKGNTATIWAAIEQEFTQKSMLLRANLCTAFLNMRASPGANLHTEFDRLRMRYEELVTLDITVSDAEYTSLIINFMPEDLSSFVAQVSMTMKLSQRIQTATLSPLLSDPAKELPVIDAETLMELALEEWDRRHSGKAKQKAMKEKEAGVAASVLSSEKPKGKGRRGPQRPVGQCWNCGGKGHRQDKCPSPKQNSDKGTSPADAKPDMSKSNPPKPKDGGANAASAATSTAATATVGFAAGAWSAFVTSAAKDEGHSSSEDSLFDREDDAYSDLYGTY